MASNPPAGKREERRVMKGERRKTKGLLLEQLLHFFFERAPRVHIAQVAFLIDQPHGRNAINAVLLPELVAPAITIEILRPAHPLLFHKLLQLAFVLL